MEAVAKACTSVPAGKVHFESFTAPIAPRMPEADSDFEIFLAQSGRHFLIPAGRSILEILEENGISAPFGCRSGFCGCCETRLVAGEPDHRDYVLSESARAANQSIMICVSRARSRSLTLDI